MNAFSSLYEVLLRLDPAAPAPTVPPVRPFFGDVIIVDLGSGIAERSEIEDPRSPTVRFASSGANAPGV